MNNPFPRAESGSYKSILFEGLNKIGEQSVATEFANGNMKLAIVNSITGNVKLYPELKEVCVKALDSLEVSDKVGYYLWGLSNEQFTVASSNGAYVYDPTDVKAVEYVKEQVELSNNEIIQPFFTNR